MTRRPVDSKSYLVALESVSEPFDAVALTLSATDLRHYSGYYASSVYSGSSPLLLAPILPTLPRKLDSLTRPTCPEKCAGFAARPMGGLSLIYPGNWPICSRHALRAFASLAS